MNVAAEVIPKLNRVGQVEDICIVQKMFHHLDLY